MHLRARNTVANHATEQVTPTIASSYVLGVHLALSRPPDAVILADL